MSKTAFERYLEEIHPARYTVGKQVGDVKDLQGVGKGLRCVVVGHGKSADGFRALQKSCDLGAVHVMAVNTPELCEWFHWFISIDICVLVEFEQGRWRLPERAKVIATIDWGTFADYHFHWKTYPDPKGGLHFRSGTRAVHLASEVMGYDEVYLVGFDYLPHVGMEHDIAIRRWAAGARDIHSEIEILQSQIAEFDRIDWKGRIYQTNKHSLLKRFPVKSLPLRG